MFIERCDLENYADDNSLSYIEYTAKAVMEALEQDAQNSIIWFQQNYMQANPTKFQFMFIKSLTSKEEYPQFLEIGDTKIERKSEVDLLGMSIDDKLKFDKHVNKLCKNAAKQLNILYRLRIYLTLKRRKGYTMPLS